MEVIIKTKGIRMEDDMKSGGKHVIALLECPRCGKDYHFEFNVCGGEPWMNQRMNAEYNAQTYINRCAPPLCIDCLIAEPAKFLSV